MNHDLTGLKFNKWTVLSPSEHREKRARDRFWFCRCECGLEKPVKACYLKNGQSKQCVNCSHETSRIRGRKIPHAYWHTLKYNAERRRISFEIDIDYIYKLLVRQKFRCALSGRQINFALTESEHNSGGTNASVDRIDPCRGYIKGNVQMVHKMINFMKHTLQQDEFLSFCESVVEYNSNVI